MQRQDGCLESSQSLSNLIQACAGSNPTFAAASTALLGNPVPSDTRSDAAEDDIREAMVDLLGPAGARQFPNLVRCIRCAEDVQSLWYLRGDLMGAVAASRGEMIARDMIASITAQFQGLLPAA